MTKKCRACQHDVNSEDRFAMAAHTCHETELFEAKVYEAGFRKFGYDQLKHAFLYQKRHSFDVKHYYNLWEHDISDIAPQLDTGKSYEAEICFESKDGIWARINYYGMSQDEVLDKLDVITGRLYCAMLALNGKPDDYQGKD